MSTREYPWTPRSYLYYHHTASITTTLTNPEHRVLPRGVPLVPVERCHGPRPGFPVRFPGDRFATGPLPVVCVWSGLHQTVLHATAASLPGARGGHTGYSRYSRQASGAATRSSTPSLKRQARTRARAHAHTGMRTQTSARKHAHARTRHIDRHATQHTHARTGVCTHTQTHRHTPHTHTLTHTHSHSHTHTAARARKCTGARTRRRR